MGFTQAILLAGYVLNILLIVFILFFERHEATNRLTWLLLVSFIPVAGPFLYILFSGNFFTRTKRMMKATEYANARCAGILGEQHAFVDALLRDGSDGDSGRYGSLIHMNILYGKSPVLAGNTVSVFRCGEEKFRALFRELERAEKTIHVSYFIIKNDGTGKDLIRILAKKAREGVTVRLLYDHVGSIATSSRLFAPLRNAGGQVVRFFPVSLLNPFSVNYRNHRKLVIIDGRSGYFGGMNVGDEYANVPGAWKHYWRDTHVRVAGSAVQMLERQFLVDWYTSAKTGALSGIKESAGNEGLATEIAAEPGMTVAKGSSMAPVATVAPMPATAQVADVPPPEGFCVDNVPMQVVSAGPDDARDDEIRDAMIHMISRARQSVYIETPYFTPDTAFYTMLKIASLSGVDVRIVVPEYWDKWYVRLAAMPYIAELLSYGVKFWHYPGFIHSKMIVVDGLVATIGSTNVDTRSFSLHFELNAFFYSEEFGRKCTEMFLDDQKVSRQATAEWFAGVSVFRKAIWNFFRLFAPLM